MNLVIEIKNYAQGDTAISYEEGKKCYQVMKNQLEKNNNVILDFTGVSYVITAFLNPVIGDTIIGYGPDIMKKITIKHASPDVIEKVKLVKEGALIKREDLDG